MEPLLALRDLSITFATPDGAVAAVRDLSLSIAPGETLAIVGESGSGKSQAMMGALGLLAGNGRATGSVRWKGQELIGAPARALDRLRGDDIAMIFQEPMTSLDPLWRVGRQMAEPMIAHRGLSAKAARARAIELLGLVGIDDPERRVDAYPHELSGGQRQRVMIGMALANEPELIVADEPTTALDVTVQAQILELLAGLRRRFGTALIFISHDLNLVRRIADRVAVMQAGRLVEEGPVEEVFARPREAYTRLLLAAEPKGRKSPPAAGAPVLIEAEGLDVHYGLPRAHPFAARRTFHAVRGVSLSLRAGQTLGVVGESGSGKSTLGRALLKLTPSTGRLVIEGRDVSAATRDDLRPLRRDLQMVFQDPFGSLSPRLTVGEIVTEGLLVHEPALRRAERERRAVAALEEVGLPGSLRNRYPHEFSGGQRQRIAIARAIVLKPRVVVLDEPTSALDRTVQGQVVELLRALQRTHGLAYLFISHDLAVVRAMADRILVMKGGRIVEEGGTDAIFERPREAYTRELMAAAMLAPAA